jgi:hypothetical protein
MFSTFPEVAIEATLCLIKFTVNSVLGPFFHFGDDFLEIESERLRIEPDSTPLLRNELVGMLCAL